MENPVFCKDCVWCDPARFPTPFWTVTNYEFAKCAHPQFISPVTGDGGLHCSLARERECGREGKFFEPKPIDRAFWKFWK